VGSRVGQDVNNYTHLFVLPLKLGCTDGCETWSLTLREELRLRVFENRVLRIV
jgi:hypothetical protein